MESHSRRRNSITKIITSIFCFCPQSKIKSPLCFSTVEIEANNNLLCPIMTQGGMIAITLWAGSNPLPAHWSLLSAMICRQVPRRDSYTYEFLYLHYFYCIFFPIFCSLKLLIDLLNT